MAVSKDKKGALVGYYKILAKTNDRYYPIKLKGLAPEKLYAIDGSDSTHYGDELMNIDIVLSGNYTDRLSEFWEREQWNDFSSRLFILKEV